MKRASLLTLFLLSSCFNPIEEGEVEINLAKFGQGKKPAIANIQLNNDQLVVTGSNLGSVNHVEVNSNTLTIISKTQNSLVLSAASQVNLLLNTALNFMVSSAYGAASVSVTFNLVDGSVTANKIGDGEIGANHFSAMGASVGQILKFDGTNWVASDLGALTYAGNWNANTNAPDLLGGGQPGEYYIVTTSGTTDLLGGAGTDDWQANDWVIWNSVLSRWEKVANSSSVVSFNGRTGAVSPQAGDYTWAQIDKTASSIADISDVDTTGIAAGKILKWDGTKWAIADDDTVGAGTVDSAAIQDGSVADIDLAGGIAQAKITGLPALATQVGTNTTNIANNVTALAGKEPSITAGLVGQYYRGDKSWQTLDSDAVAEGTNLYHTVARARSAAVLNSTAGAQTDQSASVAAMKSYVTSQVSSSGDFKADGSVAMTGNIDLGGNILTNTSEVQFDDSDTNYVTMRAPANVPANYNFVLPIDDGLSNQFLMTDGSGNTSWQTISSGASSLNDLSDANVDSSSVFLGVDAGLNDDGTNNGNVGLGHNSLKANTTGAVNVGIGLDSLASNTSGMSNVGIGYYTLFSNTTGRDNTSVGTNSMQDNLTGQRNTVMGVGALQDNTSASNNVAIGYRSMNRNTTGLDNTAIGYESLFVNNGGSRNTVSGQRAGYRNIDGDDNVAFGYFSLYENRAGGHGVAIGSKSQQYANDTAVAWTNTNTSIGYESQMGSLTPSSNTGVGNTSVGYQSLALRTSGNNNTVIGNLSGDSLTSGSNNILVGHDIDTPTATTSNHLNIGDSLYGNLATGDIAIGKVTPAAKLDVNGDIRATQICDETGANCKDISTGWSGGGEANTASNVGAGQGVFKQKSGSDLEMKSLIGGNGVTATGNIDDITLSITEGDLDITNMTGTLAITRGGTGATTAAAARTNLGLGSASLVDIGSATGEIITSESIPLCSASQKLQMSAGPVYSWSCVTDSNTNAAVLCSAGQFLNGDGSCDPIPSGQDPSYGSSASSPANAAYISDFGYLGLGTTSPQHKLHVNNGNALITGLNMGLQIKETDTVDQNWQMIVNGGALRYSTINDSLGGASEKMVLLNNGNLGVGVTDPDARVEVSGQIKITGGTPGNGKVLTSDANGLASWQTLAPPGDNLGNHTATQNIDIGSNTIVSGGGTYGLRVDNDGHVGVGIAPGYHPLRIYKNDPGSPTIQILSSTSGTGTNDGAQISLNGSVFGFDHKEAGGSFRFNTVESPTIMELRDNKVGINTYALDANLEISKNGVASSKPFMLSTDDNTNGDIFIVDQNGRVGVGTNTPAVELDLNTGVINASQICDENNANCIDLSAGSGGASAINDLTDAVEDGSSLFLGSGSGVNDDSSANKNTAIGINSMTANTTGNSNVAIGTDALKANTSGSSNFAAGASALTANTTGQGNLAIGLSAMSQNTAGEQNIAMGTQTLIVNQGDYNMAIGPGALMFNNGGNNGVAIGFEAQKNIDMTPASWTNTNTAVGYRSLLGEAAGMNNTGIDNTALGYQSLMNKTSGNNNVAIGDRAGDTITTGSNNILIGSNVDTPANSTDNYINIGNTLYGNSSSGNIGIGTNSPTSKLDVSNTFTTTVGGEYFTQNSTTIVNTGANSNGIFYGVGSKIEMVNDAFTHGGAITGGVFSSEYKGSGSLTEIFGVGGTSTHSGSGSIMQSHGAFYRSDNYSTGNIITQSGSSSRADHGGSGTVTQLIGAAGYADVSSSSGVATTAIGVDSGVIVSDTGTITNAYGLKSSLINFTGTVSNWRGLFIESPAANPNYYSIYASGTSKSYFGGSIGVGTTTPNDAMDVVGDVDLTGCLQLNDSTTLAGVCVSDKRLKNDIVPLEDSLEKILGLRPVRYTWDDNYHDIHKKVGEEIGLIAQEVEEVFPDIVVEKEDGFKRVKYDISMRLYIVGAIKEFFELFKSDKSEQDRRIASLEEENEMLKKRLERIENALKEK